MENNNSAVIMPALDPVLPIHSVSPALCEGRGSETILLVEDEPFVRNAIAEALESAGYNVLRASSAAQVLAYVPEIQHNTVDKVDLLVSDVVMPSVNGDDLALQFHALSPQTHFLLMSGYEEQIIRCEQNRLVTQYLAKPFSIPTLLQRVRQILDSKPCDRPPA